MFLDVSSDSNTENVKPQRKSVRKRTGTQFRKNAKGEWPLHVACIQRKPVFVRKLLEQGHPVNVRDHGGWSPLHEACNYGHVEIVRMLLDKGADYNDRGTSGKVSEGK